MFKIFTENGNSIGNGHVSRCLLLYDAIIKSGQQAKIFLNKDGDTTFLKDKDYELVEWWDSEVAKNLIDSDDYAIIDSYKSKKETLEVISKSSKNTLFFDDFDRLIYPEGVVFCPTLIKKDSNFLTGEEFFLIRKSFYSFQKKHISKNVKKIFLSIGTDINNCLDDIVEAILALDSSVEVHVVTNKIFQNDKVKSHYNLDDFAMAKLINECDFSIISAGQTLLENLVVKNPFILILTAENQMRNYNFVQHKGLINYFLDARESDFIERFKNIFKEQVYSKELEKFYQNVKLKDSSMAAENIIRILTKEK